MYKLVQEIKDNVNLKKIPAAGCDRLIGNSTVLSRTDDHRIAGRLPGIHSVNRGRTIKLVTSLDYFLQRHGLAQRSRCAAAAVMPTTPALPPHSQKEKGWRRSARCGLFDALSHIPY
jgi:hypothetical protein